MIYPGLKKLTTHGGIMIIVALVGILAWESYRLTTSPMIPSGKAPVIFKVANQTSARHFVRDLKARALIHSPRYFQVLIRIYGLSSRLKAGVYQINPGESAQHFLFRVVNGDVLVESFPIIEGTTQLQVSLNLKKAPYLDYNPSDWAKISNSKPSAEGLLLADTYQYQAGSRSLSLLVQANKQLNDYLTMQWESRDRQLPYRTPYELLIAASILEKESSITEERKYISGVMMNRIKRYMPLQMDPTVIYGLGSKYRGKLTKADLAVDSPYNTYKYRGLPPTPIAMVSRNAIDAAAHPIITNYLYFVAKGDGTHQFSETYTQQRRAVYRYQVKDH